MIKLSYNSQGKVSAIHIKIDGYFAQIPYNPTTQSIDWESIAYEPTRQSIQSAWDDWITDNEIDLAVELADRPDLAPTQPKSIPDWGACIRGLLLDVPYNTMIANCTNPIAKVRVELAFSIALSGNLMDVNLLANYWNLTLSQTPVEFKPSPINVQGWITLANDASLPVTFDVIGQMILI
ncbi:hypothetical protein [Nostoc sp. UHCC 0251]|uniref:hypothetical protein n=1 Tax=Nostoc sp. UHCC 0251 TaxID=3110240 RepID=UPI002B20BDE7|nr:hypothetical protein [Nostoc sp. UHCC 0251]MEA5625329.1 hypothetical protein [Nostoc sp. UHCC 0251]